VLFSAVAVAQGFAGHASIAAAGTRVNRRILTTWGLAYLAISFARSTTISPRRFCNYSPVGKIGDTGGSEERADKRGHL
jgi:hypothetical protein